MSGPAFRLYRHSYGSAFLALLLLGACFEAQSYAQNKIPHSTLAQEFVSDHGYPEVAPAAAKIEDLLRAGFVRLDLGAFELHFPRTHLPDAQYGEQFKRIAKAILDLQLTWSELEAAEETSESKALAKDAETTKKWIDGWKSKDFSDLLSAASKDEAVELGALMKAKEPQRIAWQHCQEAWGPTGEASRARRRMAFSPTRRHFLSFACWVGAMNEGYKASYWTDSIALWTDFPFEIDTELRVLALEYASPKKDAPYDEGFDMNAKSPTGLLQHVIEIAANLYCEYVCGKEVNPLLRTGLAQNLVIELYKENNARSGGSGKAKTTEEYGSFIPGGASGGGMLPTLSADNRFRENWGKDYFVRTLRQAQKRGAKEDTTGSPSSQCFILHGTDDQDHQVIRAPFLSKSAGEPQSIPARFNDDYLEFLRAYKSCFMYWLQYVAGGNKKHAAQRFGEFLRGMRSSETAKNWETALEGIFGVPLRVDDPKGDALEYRFLEWLEKQ